MEDDRRAAALRLIDAWHARPASAETPGPAHFPCFRLQGGRMEPEDAARLKVLVELVADTGGNLLFPVLLWRVAQHCNTEWALEIAPAPDLHVRCQITLRTGEAFVGQGDWMSLALVRAVRAYLAWVEQGE